MATDYKTKGYQSGFGAILEGLKTGTNEQAKQRRKINEMVTRALLTDKLARDRQESSNMFKRETEMMKYNRGQMEKGYAADQKLAAEFPDQYMPRRGTTKDFLDPYELETANKFYRDIAQERSRRLKKKEQRGDAFSGILAELAGKV